jgi:excinuclease ABC subunit A
MDSIRIRGARTHNLKNLNLDLPREKLIVITGLSGSGKSSLAFDTLYAEGQRRYVESLSAYARQFLQLMEKPDVDLIEGLSPAISIEQKATSHNPRSTVGTVTEIHDYLRLLFARVGDPYCPDHPEQKLAAMTISQMVDATLALANGKSGEGEDGEGMRLMILAPVVVNRKGEHLDLFVELRAKGFVRVRVDGKVCEIDAVPKLAKTSKHTIEVVVDRLRVREEFKQRLAESYETALRNGDGRAIAVEMDTGTEHLFSAKFACPICNYSLQELEPRLFSFNSPIGACPRCDGLGGITFFDPKRVVGFPQLSLASGAIRGWDRRNQFYFQLLTSLARYIGFDIEKAFAKLPERVQNLVLYGSGDEKIPFTYLSERGKPFTREHAFEGILPNLERRYRETDSVMVREELAKYLNNKPCPECDGTRLRREARFVKVGEGDTARAIYEISGLPLKSTMDYFRTVKLDGQKAAIADRIVKEIMSRLTFLNNVGLDYLALDRSAETLSGGEAQRIRLASQIGSGLTGVMYVLDEPSIGLHQRDNERLIGTLERLRDLGNTVIVVEHDEGTMRAADHVVDLGPGAGEHGGELVAEGTPERVMRTKGSLTGQFLSGEREIPTPKKRRKPSGYIEVEGAAQHNLRDIDVKVPLGVFCAVTGVSGSGKSTLVNEVLFKAVANRLHRAKQRPGAHRRISGLDAVDKIINIDQSPIGRTPRSNPATYIGLFDHIRDLYSRTQEARARGYKPGRFSFNVKGGRCEVCRGDGQIKIEMHFLPDVYVPCEQCHGKRYNRETLEVRFKGKTIADVLDMTVEEAVGFFQHIPKINRRLQALHDVGLDYIRLGQPATTLSGGEAQRVKLASELSKVATGRTLYILDEPTTGLHFADVQRLLEMLDRLVEQGNTVVVIEHNLDVIKSADRIIDLGPEGGEEGGLVVAAGTPEQVAAVAGSHTGSFLASIVEPAKKRQRRPRPKVAAAA